MPMISFERGLVEAGFVFVLVGTTAALHYQTSFHSPFPRLTGSPQRHDPVENYLLVLAASATAYLTARAICRVVSSAVPPALKANRFVRRGALGAIVPAVLFALYVAAGSPVIENHALVKWLVKNWERNGRKHLAWCARLFVLLVVWQGLFGMVAFALRKAWFVLSAFVDMLAGIGDRGGTACSGRMDGEEKFPVLEGSDDRNGGGLEAVVGSNGGGGGNGKLDDGACRGGVGDDCGYADLGMKGTNAVQQASLG